MILKEENTSTKRATILDSGRVANDIKREVAAAVIALWDERKVKPCLAAVRVGDDPASETYVGTRSRLAKRWNPFRHHPLPATTSQGELLELITSLNLRPDVDGILIQMPLPKGIDESAILKPSTRLRH